MSATADSGRSIVQDDMISRAELLEAFREARAFGQRHESDGLLGRDVASWNYVLGYLRIDADEIGETTRR